MAKRERAGSALAGFEADVGAAALEFQGLMEAGSRAMDLAYVRSLPRADVEEIHPDPNQPRTTRVLEVLRGLRQKEILELLDGDAATSESVEAFKRSFPQAYAVVELARNIRSEGLHQPIKLRPRDIGGYEIVLGERRWTAHVLLARSGHAAFREVPFLLEDRPLTRAEILALQVGEDWHKSKHSVIDTADAMGRMAAEWGGDVSAADVATVLSIHYKAAQRYLRVARSLTAAEVRVIASAHPDVELTVLLKLVEWLEGEQATGRFSAEQRARAIAAFAERRPRASAIPSALSQFAVPRTKSGPGRPAKTRYESTASRTDGISTYIRVPATKLSRATLDTAEKRLLEAIEQVRELKGQLFAGE